MTMPSPMPDAAKESANAADADALRHTAPTAPTAPASTGTTSTPSPVTPFGPTLAALMTIELSSGVLQVYFTPLYSQLAAAFHVGVDRLSLALTAFTLTSVVLTPLFSRLGDVYGHLRILRIQTAVVALGSVLVAAAPTFWVLVVGRVLQGAFAAFLPLMFGLIRTHFSRDRLRRGVAYLTTILLFGVVFGLLLASVLLKVSSQGMRLVLWIPAVGFLIGLALLTRMRLGDHRRPAGLSVDWPGVLLLGFGLAALLAGIDEGATWGWSSAATLSCLIGGILLVAVWAVIESRVQSPMIHLPDLLRPRLLPVYLIGFIVYFSSIGTQVAGSTFLALDPEKYGYGLGLTASQISLVSLPTLVMTMIAVSLTPRIGMHWGYRCAILVGAACNLVGFAGLLVLHASLVGYVASMLVAGLGLGFVEASTRTVVVSEIGGDEVSTGSGIYEMAISVGGAFGSATISAILSSHTGSSGVVGLGGFTWMWAVCSALGIISTSAGVFSVVRFGRGTDVTG
ncbi:MFS transporter [uncultured Bifidobacterium sp.]|uniref:MFS transporter n=1 Tax=uncultured Bifidobacterium sp. TaxID=165187 RepID=UPI0028DCA2A1|nr:MFS transporter [uncultured Bifidobacterium sp.]